MVKYAILVTYLMITCWVNAQQEQLVLKTYTENNIVYLRWAPVDVKLFELALKNGYELEYVSGANKNDALRFDALQKIKLIYKPLLPQVDSLMKLKSGEKNNLLLLQPFVVKSSTTEQKKKVFALCLLNAGYNAELANALQLRAELKQNNTMLFKVRIANTNITSAVETVEENTKAYHHTSVLSIEENRSKKLVLKWNAGDLTKYHSAYEVWRTDEAGKTDKINKTPLVFVRSKDDAKTNFMYCIDTSAEQGKTYWYKAIAYNHFALLRDTSNSVKVTIKYTFSPTITTEKIVADKNGLQLNYTVQFSHEKEHYLLSDALLLHSKKPLSNYSVIGKAIMDNTHFTASCSPQTGYYKLALISSQGDTVESIEQYYFTYDTLPPAAPKGLSGKISEAGIVHLSWTKNTESDTKGYKIFYANSLTEEFTQLPNVFCTETSFIDTITTEVLDSVMYYKVQCVDSNYNHSALSKPIALKRPDKHAPVEAVWRSIKSVDKGLLLRWNNSTSVDVKTKELVVYKAGIKARSIAFKKNDTTTVFLDTMVEPGILYRYEIITKDANGNSSTAKSAMQKFEPGYRKALRIKMALANREKKQIELTWETGTEKYFKVDVYRKKGDEKMVLYKTLPGDALHFTDRQLNINNTYTYCLRAITLNGIATPMSEEVVVRY